MGNRPAYSTTAFSAGRVRPSRATWLPSRWYPTRPGGALARACPRRSAPRGATPTSPEHEVGRGPARDVAGSRPAPQGLDRTRGLETGSPAQGETGSSWRRGALQGDFVGRGVDH